MEKIYVQYGCGLVAPKGWINFDASPTLLIQKIPIVGKLVRPIMNCVFPDEVRYGNIVKGLPMKSESCDGIFCSHVLEHLPLESFYKALHNTFKVLKPGGTFRCIVPDMETYCRDYMNSLSKVEDNEAERANASIRLLKKSLLGMEKEPKGLKGLATLYLGHSGHRWMWDRFSLSKALSNCGFVDIVPFQFNESGDNMFLRPEAEENFRNAIALECKKPALASKNSNLELDDGASSGRPKMESAPIRGK